jgi:C4-dicarboxylate transporter DctQ subunit
LLAVLLVLICTIIFTRYIGVSWVWLYDLARWCLIWVVFVGAISLTGRGAHLTVDVAAEALPLKIRVLGQIAGAATTCVVALIVAYYGWLEVYRMYTFGERSMSGRLPAFLGYSVLPLAFALLALASLGYMRRVAKQQSCKP